MNKIINIQDLNKICELSKVKCANFSEAAAVCLENRGHKQNVKIIVEGAIKGEFQLQWKTVTPKIIDSWNDLDYAVEDGAYCLAIFIIDQLTNFKVVKQSKKKTGFDYWLGDKKDTYPFQEKGRLEVSGILRGSKGQTNWRVKVKLKQTEQSNYLKIPVFIVVVEFSTPLIKTKKYDSFN